MKTPSLRRRVVLWAVGALAVLLLVVGVGVDLALGAVLKAEQQDRLRSLASLGTELTGLSDKSLADRLSIAGIRAVIRTSDGAEIVGVPQAPPGPGRGGPPGRPQRDSTAAEVAVTEEGGRMVATTRLRPGVSLVLTSDSGQTDAALLRFRWIMTIASVAAVLLAAVGLPLLLRRALRPLDALTLAARDTAAGGRGRRLAPEDPGTDLGRAAAQFDAMLEELEGAERRAEQAAERLGRFLSDASHELRTPLAGVSTGAERLIREPLDDAERDRVTVQVVREARRAARLVDDLLLVSRLGDLVVDARPVSLRALLEDGADRAAARPGMPVVEVVGPDATVAADRERIDQVLANLVGNAMHAGATRVRFRSAMSEEGALVRISDDGPGIPMAAREAVFERLVRLDAGRSPARGGAGLGLPIARGLVEAHGGALAIVDGTEADLPGATFLLRLRIAPPEQVATPAVTPRSASGRETEVVRGR